MSVGILLITHEGVGSTLLATANRLLGQLPLPVESYELPYDGDLEALLPQASAALRRVDVGEGVLVLTDVYGASPSKMAARVASLGTPVRRVAGLSLPMLLRALNYADQDLDALALTAATGGRNGVVAGDA